MSRDAESRVTEPGAHLPFYKLSGGGNDFVALVEPPQGPTAESVRALCRRGLSVGADGLFVLRRTGTGARMDYFNADGRSAELCLNGARCAVRLAHHLGWGDDGIILQTGAGALRGRAVGDTESSVEVPVPERPMELTVDLGEESLHGWRLRVGVPHFVLIRTGSLASAPVGELGPALRSHPVFGVDGTNVNFVRFTAPDSFDIRSYERGVEAETLACGTGVLAAAVVGRLLGRLELPAGAQTLGGFVLRLEEGASPTTWLLTGDARILAGGHLEPGAERLPPPPGWDG
jgi:diaminopimelate epimerase